MHVSADGPNEPQSSLAPALSPAIEQINAPTAATSRPTVHDCGGFVVACCLVCYSYTISFDCRGGASDWSNSDQVNSMLKTQIGRVCAHTFDRGYAPD